VAAFIVRPTVLEEGAGEVATEPGIGAAGERGALKPVDTQPEMLVRGLVRGRSGKPIRQGVVTVLHPDGRHVDWGRTDNEGRYVLALPSAGRYLVVASADGWAPQSGLVEIGHGELEPITMTRRLLLSGRVTDDGTPLGAVMLSLIRHSGEYVATAHAEPDGRYEVGLPPPGRYVLTIVDHATGRTRSRAVQIGNTSATVDVDIVTGVPQTMERAS